jgi:NADPH-dependent 2,4-dienoyl-CoA reductase/sulfur reductase-like enzyme
LSPLNDKSRIVVVGASLAGLRTVEGLRARGFGGVITVIGDEDVAFYDRPPLSKQVLTGSWDDSRVVLRSIEEIGALRIDVRGSTPALGLDLDRRVVRTASDDVAFDAVVLATGSRARTWPGVATHAKMHTVRTLRDCERLRDDLQPGARVVVIGAGFIGAEVAAAAKHRGATVIILEALPVPLQRQLGVEMGQACGDLHARNGVELRCGISIASIDQDGVHLASGELVGADVIVIGIGAAPNVEWLEGSGLWLDNGVRSNDRGVVLDDSEQPVEGVYAVGDIARFPHALYGSENDPTKPELMRLEHWTNAAELGDHVAGSIMGEDLPYVPVPYFWSDQYAHKIQFLGRSTGYDEVRVVVGSVAEGAWLALYRRADKLIGALGVSKIRALMPYRTLLANGASWHQALAAVPQT